MHKALNSGDKCLGITMKATANNDMYIYRIVFLLCAIYLQPISAAEQVNMLVFTQMNYS